MFEVVGTFAGQRLSAAADHPDSAILTAERWTQSGVMEVRIVWNGTLFDIAGFCRHFGLNSGSSAKPSRATRRRSAALISAALSPNR